MVAHEHRRPRLAQPALLIFNLEPYPCEKPHAPFKGARGGPLAEATVADDVEGRGGGGAVAGAEEEGEEGGDAAAVEFDGVDFEGLAEEDEGLGEQEDGQEEEGDVGEDCQGEHDGGE